MPILVPAIDAPIEAQIAIANQAEVRPGLVALAGSDPRWYRPITKPCLLAAAKEFKVDAFRLVLLLEKEDGRLGTARRNPRSLDLGPGQVNTIHLADISAKFGVPYDLVPTALIYDGCFNVRVMSWLLKIKTDEAGGDYWQGIARYHNNTPSIGGRYLNDVVVRARRMLASAKMVELNTSN